MIGGIVVHPYTFVIVFVAFLFITLLEFYNLSKNIGFTPQRVTGLASGILLFLIFFFVANDIIPTQYLFLALLIPLAIFLSELFGKRVASVKNSAVTVSGIVYIALPFSLLNFIVIPGNSGVSGYYPWILVGIFLIIWMYDSMAYVTGSLIGKRKIYAKISPKKSWEGLIGGAIFAVIMGILNAVLFNQISITNWIIISILVVIFGTSGDFFESKLKREAGVKDSGNIMPGHGGMLDRFDSLLFAAPVIFIWLNLFGNI